MTNEQILQNLQGRSIQQFIDDCLTLDQTIKSLTKQFESYKNTLKELADSGCKLETEKTKVTVSVFKTTEILPTRFINLCGKKDVNFTPALTVKRKEAEKLLSKNDIDSISVVTGEQKRISFKAL